MNVLFDIQNSDTEPRWSGWLLPWIAGIYLLRTTEHVLDKVEKKKSHLHKKVISQKWKDWKTYQPENWIFWEFIEEDRNNILKEFQLGFETTPYAEANEYEVEEAVYEKMNLFRESVYWWRQQLREIEQSILDYTD